MREKKRIQGDLDKIFARYGYSEFQWADIRDLVDNSPIFYAYGKSLICNRKDNIGRKFYKINPEYMIKKSKYKIKKSRLYPVKAFQ